MLQHLDEFGRLASIELIRRKRLRFLVLNAIEPGEMVVAVWAGGRVMRAVGWTSRVVVNSDLVVEIHQIHCAIRTDSAVDGLEPIIGAGQKMRLLSPLLASTLIAHAGRLQKFV